MSYALVVGRLIDVILRTKLDMAYIMSVKSRYQANPRKNTSRL